MVATLYDESLDVFRFHNWYASFFNSQYARLQWQSINGFKLRALTIYNNSWNAGTARSPESIDFDSFNWFGYSFYDYFGRALEGRVAGVQVRRSARYRDGEDKIQAAMAPAAEMAVEER